MSKNILQLQLRAWDPANFACIYESMALITNDVEIDAYYLSHGLWSCLNERHTVEAINDLVNFYHKTLHVHSNVYFEQKTLGDEQNTAQK